MTPYKINKNFVFKNGYNLQNSKKTAEFPTDDGDLVKSPVIGLVNNVTSNSIQIKDNQGYIFLISNLKDIRLQPYLSVSNGDTVGKAQGKITLEIFDGTTKQNVEQFLNFQAPNNTNQTNEPTKNKENTTNRVNPENLLWRTVVSGYTAPLNAIVQPLANKIRPEVDEEIMFDESLFEDIKRIKKLLK